MSSNDGGHATREDVYLYQHDMSQPAQLLQQQQQEQQQQHLHVTDAGIAQLPAHQVMWQANHHAMLPPHAAPQQFMHQTPPHLHQHQQQQQQHHQRYNEFMFNMHAPQAFMQPPGQPETYSVLPVGHGNFLKVYHCNDALSAGAGAAADLSTAGIYAQQQQQQQQQAVPPPPTPSQAHFTTAPVTAQHFAMQAHLQQQQQPPTSAATAQQLLPQQPATQYKHLHTNATTTTAAAAPQTQTVPQQPQIFNSYELFASNPLLPAACETKFSASTPQQQLKTNKNNNNTNIQSSNNHQSLSNEIAETTVAVTTTNMIINKLVNNWSPNLTGVAYTQLSAPTPPPAAVENFEQQITAMPDGLQQQNEPPKLTQLNATITTNEQHNVTLNAIIETQQQAQEILTQTIDNTLPVIKSTILQTTVSPTMHDNTIKTTTPTNKNNNYMPEVVKKRIVAEVKPMRMTYSDVVLSKVNYAQKQQNNVQNQTTSMRNVNKVTQLVQNERGKINQNSALLITTPTVANATATTNGINKRASEEARGSKKSPTHEQKETTIAAANNNKTTSKRNNNTSGQVKSKTGNKQTQVNETTYNNNVNVNNTNNNNTNNGGNSNTAGINSKKRNNGNIQLTKDMSNNINKKPTTIQTNTANNNNNNNNTSNNSEKENAYYERVTRKATTTATTSKINNNLQNNNGNNNGQAGISTSSYTRTRNSASNLNNSSSYSYSTRRHRSSYYHNNSSPSTYYGTTASTSYAGSNRNYELAKKLLSTWCEYMLKVLTWLFYLVYDIVVIGCSIAYDSLAQNALAAWTQLYQLRNELQQNSNKPGLWWRNFWRRFDARFAKNSRWAFWRRFYPKKPPPTATTETFKSGRLPQTGEEAMYSLLNCKGKNAYSILGVPLDSSQEQIRKHYKKIAVLVHPDKNKQAGAEEAFKVLQRAFELIGEPENRHAYDQSLAEALHAEKAWTEFHDLLSQLHTKITEAANTIRCSTCSLRHPRKLTDRPHYAARECASCKIRHSAREGDIWAESSMLGLRWKYLALMEGKVYDITEWANCQKGALSHLEPNSHMVQYRIVRGAQQQQPQQQQQQQNQQQQASNQRQQRQQSPGFDSSGVGGFGTASNAFGGAGQYASDIPTSEASLHEFLDNLYSGQNPNQPSGAYSNSSRRRSRRN